MAAVHHFGREFYVKENLPKNNYPTLSFTDKKVSGGRSYADINGYFHYHMAGLKVEEKRGSGKLAKISYAVRLILSIIKNAFVAVLLLLPTLLLSFYTIKPLAYVCAFQFSIVRCVFDLAMTVSGCSLTPHLSILNMGKDIFAKIRQRMCIENEKPWARRQLTLRVIAVVLCSLRVVQNCFNLLVTTAAASLSLLLLRQVKSVNQCASLLPVYVINLAFSPVTLLQSIVAPRISFVTIPRKEYENILR